jgi:DNA-binding transcriptional ArsR family regulator
VPAEPDSSDRFPPPTAGPPAEDAVFKALADRHRRLVLDRLHERSGQSLGELCAGMGMSRQAVTKHLAVLIDAGLVTVRKQGRERLHYLDPVPISEIHRRWTHKFERARLDALHTLKSTLERP